MADIQILVVEDEAILAFGLQTQLEDLGYNVVDIVPSGEIAIQKIKELQSKGGIPDLILMDIVLEGEIDGIETVRQIKDSFNIPVIYLTAHTNEETLNRARTTMPSGYLTKPVLQEELRTMIKTVFR